MRLKRSASLENSFQTLRSKTLLAVGVTLTSVVSVLYLTASSVLLQSFSRAEVQQMHKEVERSIAAYQASLTSVDVYNETYAAWDDTYQFVDRPSEAFIEANFVDSTFTSPNVDVILIYNLAQQRVYADGYDHQQQHRIPAPASLETYLRDNSELLQPLATSRTGVILLPEGPMLLSVRAILTSDLQGPARGVMIMGRYLNAANTAALTEATRLPIQFHRLDTRLPTTLRSLPIASSTISVQVQPQSDRFISGYTVLRDFNHQPVLLMQVDAPRELYDQGQKSLHCLVISLIVAGVVFGLATWFVIETLIAFGRERRVQEARCRAVVTQSSEGIVFVDAQTKNILDANVAFYDLLGYAPIDLQHLTLYDVIADDRAKIETERLLKGEYHFRAECQYRRSDQSTIDVEVSANRITWSDLHRDGDCTPTGLQSSSDVFCIVIRDITARKASEAALRDSEQRLAWQATHDALTGLVNRREFERLLAQALQDPAGYILCYLDLDQFKIVNDTCGHGAGDELLRQVTTMLQSQIRPNDVLGRLGGDEFGLLLQQCELEQALSIASRVRQSVWEFRFAWRDHLFSIGVSIGMVALNPSRHTLATALSAADAACYVAKHKGRNQVHLYQVGDHDLAEQQGQMLWAMRLTHALENNQFCLYYQPIAPVAFTEQQGEHYEVLLRLKDESGQLIEPAAFIPAAEHYHLMHLLDRWVIRTFFSAQARNQSPSENSTFAINLSQASIDDEHFIDFLQEQFCLHNVPPAVICFEIAETVAIANLNRTAQFMQACKQLGCRFALDDFGSSMMSFAYLKNLPVDYLKIDGNFIRSLAVDPAHFAMTGAINLVGHLMGMQTVAELVENDLTLERLRTIGIDFAQGVAIAAPRTLENPSSYKNKDLHDSSLPQPRSS